MLREPISFHYDVESKNGMHDVVGWARSLVITGPSITFNDTPDSHYPELVVGVMQTRFIQVFY